MYHTGKRSCLTYLNSNEDILSDHILQFEQFLGCYYFQLDRVFRSTNHQILSIIKNTKQKNG